MKNRIVLNKSEMDAFKNNDRIAFKNYFNAGITYDEIRDELLLDGEGTDWFIMDFYNPELYHYIGSNHGITAEETVLLKDDELLETLSYLFKQYVSEESKVYTLTMCSYDEYGDIDNVAIEKPLVFDTLENAQIAMDVMVDEAIKEELITGEVKCDKTPTSVCLINEEGRCFRFEIIKSNINDWESLINRL